MWPNLRMPCISSDLMKLVTHVAGFADYYKQLVPAHLQGGQFANMIAAVRDQAEKSGRVLLSVQGAYSDPASLLMNASLMSATMRFSPSHPLNHNHWIN